MSNKVVDAARERAEKLWRSQPRPLYPFDQEIALLKQRSRAQDEKTARLRALRLAKEAEEAKDALEAGELSPPVPAE
jgi:hypothetical protein